MHNDKTTNRQASLGIGFQPNPPSMPLNNQKPTPIFLYFYLLIFFHPFNPYNPCSIHLRVFFEHGFIGLTRMLRSVSEYHNFIKSVISL